MEKTRILHIVSNISIGNGIMGVIMNYYRNIDLQEFQFDFLFFQDTQNTYEAEINKMGGKIYKLNQPTLKNLLHYTRYANAFFEDNCFSYPIVHTHELALITFVYKALRLNGTKHIISHSHSVSYSYRRLNAIRNYILSRPIKKIADSFFSCSEASAKFWYGESYLRNKRVKIIKNAIDCDNFLFNEKVRNETRKTLGLDGYYVVGHVGRFAQEKNHEYLIKIFYELTIINPKSILLLVGDGEKKNDIEKIVFEFGLRDKVIFLGQRSDVNKLYQAMDAFVFPSIGEGLPVTVIEAQTSGLACFLSDTITREVNVYNAIFLSLKLHPQEWAHEINMANSFRENSLTSVQSNGYCIKSEVKNLVGYYEWLIENCGYYENRK